MTTKPTAKRRTRLAAVAKPAQRWHGAIEGMHRDLLFGWAVDSQHPDARPVLEVCLNGEVIGCVIADVARRDLMEEFARVLPRQTTHDACHGFVADLGDSSVKQNGLLTVRVANTDAILTGRIDRHEVSTPPVAATSSVFSDGALRLHGWAIDAKDEKRAIIIRAFIGSQEIAQAVANMEHPALRTFDVGSHGFSLNLPLALADGRSHIVRLIDEAGAPLNGSPITVCCHAAGCKSLLDGTQTALLTDAIDVYERYLPRSLGMEHYCQWSAMFDAPDATTRSTSALRVGLIVTGDDRDAIALTTTSLMQQTDADVSVFSSLGKGKKVRSFDTLLKLALDAECDIIGCVRAGDTLTPNALAYALEGFADADAQIVYSDSEQAGAPWFKPAWNPDYALSSDYPLELMLTRSDLIRAVAKTNSFPTNQASLSWTMLASQWSSGDRTITHVPRVLYRFGSPLSEAEQQARTEAAQQALKAVEPTVALIPAPGAPANAGFQARRVQPLLSTRDKNKTVSLIIPTRDRVELLQRCIASIRQFTQWPNLEIIIIDNDSTDAKTKTWLRAIARQGVKVLPMPGPFNYAALNNRAVEAASGDIIGLINNDIEALHDGWLDEIVGQLMRPGVGAVGAKLLWPNGMVQHGGVLLGIGNVAGHFGNRLADADWGDHGRNQLLQQVSGATAACLFLRKRDYLGVGGMDETAFPVTFNDVDLCLKLRKQGKSVVWTPYARMLHAESASRGHEDTPQKRSRAQREIDHLRQRWGDVLLRDPAYHPSLNLDAHSHAFGGLAMPPRERCPRTANLFEKA